MFHLLLSSGFLPHGTCYLWNAKIVWLHVLSDSTIAISYYGIPLALVYLARKRRDIPFNWMFWMFAIFILGCGTTHLMEVWTVWRPVYLLSGMIKAITAAASIATAVVLMHLLPKAIALPGADQLYGLNRELQRQVNERVRSEKQLAKQVKYLEQRVQEKSAQLESIDKLLEKETSGIEVPLRWWALAGTAVALLATAFLGFLCWRSVVQASQDAGWVAHTQQVRNALQVALRHADDLQNYARAYEVTGQEHLLAEYDEADRLMLSDLQTLRLLTADNPSQLQRLQALDSSIHDELDYCAQAIAERQKTSILPPAAMLAESVRPMDEVRHVASQMDAAERDLMEERSRASRMAQHRTKRIIVGATLVSAVFLVIAGWIVRREAERSGRLRAQLKKSNADLERRVEQRTAALRESEARLEQRVHERTAELEAANKELEAFTYSVSHDLRAPLRHISGFSKMLAEQAGSSLPPEAQHYLQRIQDGIHRMGLLVDDLLNLTRIGRHELKVQVTGLESIVKDVIADLTPEAEGRAIQWRIGELPFIEGDPALLKIVFQNLLANAVKYTRPRAKAVIEIGSETHQGLPAVFIRDNGVGFNMKYADKLFGVFQRLHRAEDFEGTGVGLAIVQRIVQKHGGRIWAEAELDKGATFYLVFGASRTASFAIQPALAENTS